MRSGTQYEKDISPSTTPLRSPHRNPNAAAKTADKATAPDERVGVVGMDDIGPIAAVHADHGLYRLYPDHKQRHEHDIEPHSASSLTSSNVSVARCWEEAFTDPKPARIIVYRLFVDATDRSFSGQDDPRPSPAAPQRSRAGPRTCPPSRAAPGRRAASLCTSDITAQSTLVLVPLSPCGQLGSGKLGQTPDLKRAC
jgi:hypothetical protein